MDHTREALEMAAASWVFQKWAESLQREGVSGGRKIHLTEKILEAEKAIASGKERGRRSQIPFEIVRNEYRFVAPQAHALWTTLRKTQAAGQAAVQIASATCEYGSAMVRPFWLREDPKALEKLARRVYGRKQRPIRRETFARILTGELFGISESAVRAKLGPQETRPWEGATPDQQYLVALFTVGARGDKGKPGYKVLHSILQALCDSGYLVLGLYHLAKRAREEPCQLRRDFKFPTSAVRRAIYRLKGPQQ